MADQDDLVPDENQKKTPQDTPPAAGPAAQPGPDEPRLSGIGLALGICDALLAAVGRDQFHGGVRPDNITVRDNVVSLGGRLRHGVGEFTPQELEYMAPELFWDGLRTPAADVYSTGLVLYSVYNYGRLPFWPAAGTITPNDRAGALQKRMSGEEILPPAAAGQELADIILRALSFRTEERWQDAQELKDALSGCTAEEGPADISLVISGLIARGAEPMPAAAEAAPRDKGGAPGRKKEQSYDEPGPGGDEPFPTTARRRTRRRGGLSWLWIVILLAFIGGSLFLLLHGCEQGGSTAGTNAQTETTPSVLDTTTPTPTAEPTPTPTAEPTATPAPTATPEGPRYVVYKEDVSWSEAVKLCEEKGGWLAYPSNDEELKQIEAVCDAAELEIAWMGASRQTDGSWLNARDGVVTYFFWVDGTGEPSFTDSGDGAKEDYMMLWKMNGVWAGNDSREDPLADYYWSYAGRIGYVCQFY